MKPIISACAFVMTMSVCEFSYAKAHLEVAASHQATVLASSASQPPINESERAQAQLKAIADNLKVNYQLLTNVADDDCVALTGNKQCFRAQLVFTSAQELDLNQVAIYFSHIRPIHKTLVAAANIERLQGDLHRVELSGAAAHISADTPLVIPFIAQLWQLAESDVMPNYYVVKAGLEPEIIASTRLLTDAETGMEVKPYAQAFSDESKHYRRGSEDQLSWITTSQLYDENQPIDLSTARIDSQIIPSPTDIKRLGSGSLSLAAGIKVSGEVKVADVALERLASLGLTQQPAGVHLQLDYNQQLADEAYTLVVNDDGINIQGGSARGMFYGLMSLASLLDVAQQSVAKVSISDSPRYPFRGVHIDVARNFHDVGKIHKLLDQMAAYKLNKLHLHMADDEGWRLQIPDLAELTDIGGKRCHDLSEHSCLLPQLGSGPDPRSAVNGYYTRQQYIELLRYAKARHIQIIPSMDMPGHSRAAIKAMDARSAKLSGAAAQQYRLSDPQDTTQYSSIQHYNDNTMNVCLESSFRFIDKVIDEIALMHQEAGTPLSLYHIGADETAGAWLESPACHEFVANNPYDVTSIEQLGGYFIERISQLLAAKGIAVAGWSDGMSHTRLGYMPANVQSNIWDSLYHQGHVRAHQHANQGWDTVVSVPDVLYFDMPYVADPKEHGYYWAMRANSTRKVFEFMAGNLAANAEQWHDINGKPYVADDTKQLDAAGVTIQAPLAPGRDVIGIQGQIWSETIRSHQLVDYLTFPRLLMLAERAWHKPEWEVPYQAEGAIYHQDSGYFTPLMRQQQLQQWQVMANTLGHKELRKLDLANVAYRVPLAGARVVDGLLHMNSRFPGLPLEYQTQDGRWHRWIQAVAVDLPVNVRVRSATGERAGRQLTLTN
ncbi:family 20 glycosylhydrolase [Shewanella sp. NIFS-20-20]|uniref:family 20 glycosylhydrolase n=1 Tax=Shewanella sp. NIFS-20-20 TaxID=2853806 RepID=UPI001C47603C|nr:family 20 glycosylhydrolase [Shewanella sp. NIFS-20-20]MBV7315434.1 carbohydate-binding domain-containing protein [Shewanella sp. NIFS-20-20]